MDIKRPSSRRARILCLWLAASGVAAGALGQSAAWQTSGPPGGSVYCVVPDPVHPARLYACTLHGVYRSEDTGASWQFSWGGLPDVRVQTIAVDPTGSGTLYAGTVTPDGVPSVGIFKSTDGAVSWAPVNDGLVDPIYGFEPIDVESLAIDPHDPSRILAGTRLSEVFQSVDAGATWQARTSGGYDVQLETSAIQFDPSGSGKVYAASTVGFLLSNDNGATWGQFGDGSTSLYSLAVDPTNPKTLYAGSVAGGGLFKSIDGGNHWGTINNGLPVSGGSLPQIVTLVVDPAHATTIYAGSYGNGVFQTTSSGATWAAASGGLRSAYVSSFAFDPGGSGTLYAGTFGGGVYETTDSAHTWTSHGGLDLARITALAADPVSAATVYASAFDGVFKTVDAGGHWQLSSAGLPVNPVAALALVPSGSGTLFAGTLGGGLWKSGDGGASWSQSAQGLTDAYISALAVDPTNPSVLYAGTTHTDSTSQRVYKSTDGGATWTRTSLDGQSFTLDRIAVNPGKPSQVAVVSLAEAGYFQSLDAGKTWSNVALDSSCGTINGILFDPGGTITYVAGSAGMCQSSDAGKTWSVHPVGASLSVEVLIQDPSSPATIYAGTSVLTGGVGGVFRSTDGGQTWTGLGTGLEYVPVTSLVLDAHATTLHAGIDGGGVAELILVADRAPVDRPAASHQPRSVGPRP